MPEPYSLWILFTERRAPPDGGGKSSDLERPVTILNGPLSACGASDDGSEVLKLTPGQPGGFTLPWRARKLGRRWGVPRRCLRRARRGGEGEGEGEAWRPGEAL